MGRLYDQRQGRITKYCSIPAYGGNGGIQTLAYTNEACSIMDNGGEQKVARVILTIIF